MRAFRRLRIKESGWYWSAFRGVNQSRLLVQQVDEHRELPESFWRKHFTAAAEKGAVIQATAPIVIRPPGLVRRQDVTKVNPAMQAAFEQATARDESSPVSTLMDTIAAETWASPVWSRLCR